MADLYLAGATATVAAGSKSVSVAGLNLSGVKRGMTLYLGSADGRSGNGYRIDDVNAASATSGTITTAGAVPSAFNAAPFVIDSGTYNGTISSLVLNQVASIINAFLEMTGALPAVAGDREITLNKSDSARLSQLLFAIAGQEQFAIRQRNIGGKETLCVSYDPDGMGLLDAIQIDRTTGQVTIKNLFGGGGGGGGDTGGLTFRVTDLEGQTSDLYTKLDAERAARIAGQQASSDHIDSATAAEASRATTAEAGLAATALDIVTRAEAAVDAVTGPASLPSNRYRYAYVSTRDAVTIPATDDVLRAWVVIGQSNAEAATSGAPLATTPLYYGRALMPDTGLHPDYGATGFQALVEGGDRFTNESLASGMVNHLIRDLDNRIGSNCGFAIWNAAIGGSNYAQLKQGSLAWRRTMEPLAGMVEAAGLRGQRMVVGGAVLNHGENAVGDFTGLTVYARMLDQWQRTLQSDIQRVTGQIEPVILYIVQTAFIWASQSSVLGQQIQMAQIEAAARNPYIRLVGPQYQFPINGADGIHKTSAGANQMGQMCARAVLAEEFGVGWVPLQPRDAYLSLHTDGQARRVVVPVDVPVEPLVLDTSDVIIGLTGGNAGAPNYGFDAWGPGGAALPISGVSILNASTTATTVPTIAVDLANAPPVPWLRLNLGMRRNSELSGAGTVDGPREGARTPWRDSANHASLYGQPAQNNWMVSWSRRVICNAAPGGGSV